MNWSHVWDAKTGSMVLLRDGRAYSSLFVSQREAPVSVDGKRRRGALYLLDMARALLEDDDHPWTDSPADLDALLSTVALAITDIRTGGSSERPADDGDRPADDGIGWANFPGPGPAGPAIPKPYVLPN